MILPIGTAPGCCRIGRMDQLARLGVHLLEGCFFAGLVGSASVVLFSVVDDVKDLFFKSGRS